MLTASLYQEISRWVNGESAVARYNIFRELCQELRGRPVACVALLGSRFAIFMYVPHCCLLRIFPETSIFPPPHVRLRGNDFTNTVLIMATLYTRAYSANSPRQLA
jgi:hypothetical protein